MAPPPVQPQPADARQGVTRNDLVALGRAGRPWDYVPIALRALAQAPHDAGVRFLLAANLARLGLRTLAKEIIGDLPGPARSEPDVLALAAAIEQLPDDRVPPAARRTTALGNLRALRARGLDPDGALSAAFEAWSTQQDGSECFLAADGNLVRRPTHQGAPAWSHFMIDQRSAAARFCEQNLGPSRAFHRALAIEGMDPPWLFDRAWRTLARNPVGYTPPITVLQADPLEFFDGLSAMDLREQLVDPRVSIFVGIDASSRWLNDAIERIDEAVLGTTVAVPGARTRISPPAQAVAGRASAAQTEEFRRRQARVATVYASRDRAWWARRYRDARQGGPPLRVLVPTSRYSTYVRHAAEDLAAAFAELGCDARVAMEAGPSSMPSAVGHLRPIVEFEPDLIALVNYFRGDAGLPFPEQAPWVCWLQDAMPHHFAERRWGELDFVTGHVHKELTGRSGFPQERSMPFPVVASARKFHPEPVAPELAERFACEVAYVSHQSETPAVFHERCKAEDGELRTAVMLDELRPLVETEATEPMGKSLLGRLEQLTREVAHRLDDAASEASVCHVFRHYALPLADRVLRHQTLLWAADVCEKRGWRLGLFGRGWENHPGLARYARGELAHGEELRACYQSATVHLHASVTTLVHQRVMECSLSGGLPMARLTFDGISESTGFAKRETLLHCQPCARDAATGNVGYRTAECPALAAIGAMRERLGQKLPEVVWITPAQIASFRRPDHQAATGLHPAWLYDGFSELTFRSADELERIAGRAIEDRAWRAASSRAMAARVRERCTTEVFAKNVLAMVTESLAGSSPHPESAAA